MKFSLTFTLLTALATQSHADPAGDLLNQVARLHQTKFEAMKGTLFLNWLQFDENDPSFVVFIGNRKYEAKLDDGRGTTEKAIQCPKDNPFDHKPDAGCKILFDGQYLVEDNGGDVKVSTILWNVKFAQ